jgi:hypothetical protein
LGCLCGGLGGLGVLSYWTPCSSRDKLSFVACHIDGFAPSCWSGVPVEQCDRGNQTWFSIPLVCMDFRPVQLSLESLDMIGRLHWSTSSS